MALATCPKCSAEVSESDKHCSGCGFDTTRFLKLPLEQQAKYAARRAETNERESLAGTVLTPRAVPDQVTELRAFVGPNADYYLRKWLPLLQGGKVADYNWAAFFLSPLWLPYRKMYRWTLAVYGLLLLTAILKQVTSVLGMSGITRTIDFFVLLLIALICGQFGNRWYLAHGRKAMLVGPSS